MLQQRIWLLLALSVVASCGDDGGSSSEPTDENETTDSDSDVTDDAESDSDSDDVESDEKTDESDHVEDTDDNPDSDGTDDADSDTEDNTDDAETDAETDAESDTEETDADEADETESDRPDAGATETDEGETEGDETDDGETDDGTTDEGGTDEPFEPMPPSNPDNSQPPGVQGDIYNREAVVPPMCYTQTTGLFNPCYVCHQDEIRGTGRANFQNDGFLQGDYFFSDVATHNHWTNLFIERSEEVAAISDEEIDVWVDTDNYSEFVERMQTSEFEGYVPVVEGLAEAGDAFDDQGFALDDSHWVAFNYKPLPSTFWPTNGATDDVMVKLPAEFRQKDDGSYSRDVYLANLSIMEAAVKGYASITVPTIDESEIGTDLNGDGELTEIDELNRPSNYVGQASGVEVVIFLYPAGVSFLHTVRYVGIDEEGGIVVPKRMKEVRYMIKERFMSKHVIAKVYSDEYQEKQSGMLPRYSDRQDQGVNNKTGWLVNGFIEDEMGDLRHQNFEERFFCMGCHNSVGSTIDSTFAFPRKVDGAEGWGYINLHGMPDAPSVGETEGEISLYLRRVGGGSEFRHNGEMAERFFDGTDLVDDALDETADVYEMITPSPDRARMLNKAYRVLIEQQNMPERGLNHGRDPTAVFPINVFDDVDPETVPVLPEERQFTYDLRVDWAATQ